MSEDVLTLSLLSHTNVGKTTLARTLLRRDVGEVVDQAHITRESSCYVLLELAAGNGRPHGRILLWDTPGFGDSANLLRRLEVHDDPIAWLEAQSFDPDDERALHSSREAILHLRREASVVLYLVNASEDPEAAGYVEPEMKILGWLERPVIVLLNQTGPAAEAEARRRAEERWRWHLASHSAVRDVIHLDAFSRCWVQEGLLLLRLQALVPEVHEPLMGALIEHWWQQHLGNLRASVGVLADALVATASEGEPVDPDGGRRLARKRSAEAILARHTARVRDTVGRLVEIHGLEGNAAALARASLEDVSQPGDRPDPRRAGALGGIVGGALGGFAADLAHGGLTFGGGTVVGAVLGGLGLGGLAWSFEQLGGEREPRVAWSDAFLERELRDAVLRYLALAHFGRGSGEFSERPEPAHWGTAVEHAMAGRSAQKRSALGTARAGSDAAPTAELLFEVVVELLIEFYPGCERFLAKAAFAAGTR